MKKMEYDFSPKNWTSFPSSYKLINDEETVAGLFYTFEDLPVEPGKTLKIQVKAKQSLVTLGKSGVTISFWDGANRIQGKYLMFPIGDFDWQTFESEQIIPPGAINARSVFYGGGGKPQGITWFDDLKIYQDGGLIYANDFTAPIAKGAVMAALSIVTGLGVVRFGKKG